MVVDAEGNAVASIGDRITYWGEHRQDVGSSCPGVNTDVRVIAIGLERN